MRRPTPSSCSCSAAPAGRAAPQVHGHDFSCVAALPLRRDVGHAGGGAAAAGARSAGSELGLGLAHIRYASGSEEKVLRVLEAPQAFHDTLAAARGRGAAGNEHQVGFQNP
jgi:elongator complex protein 2